MIFHFKQNTENFMNKCKGIIPMIIAAWSFFLAMAASSALAQPETVPSVIHFESKTGAVRFNHQLHAEIPEITCTTCHHTDKGKEIAGDCRSCHPAQKVTGKLNTREAFHKQCINCHKEREKKNQAAGPAKACSGCHKK